MKGKIAWIVIEKEYADISPYEVYFEEPPEYKLFNTTEYEIKKIVYFEVE